MNSEEFERNRPTTARPPPPKGQGVSKPAYQDPKGSTLMTRVINRYTLNNNSEGHFLLHDQNGFITYEGTFVSEEDFEDSLKENERLKRGDFTKEEFQALCHHLNEEDKNLFCDGCDEYQRKLFGTSRMDDLNTAKKGP